MADQTVLPLIRTRKRRLVPPDKRKKASFSCDRCKVRKIACHRGETAGPCEGCSKAGIECATTIKRKKKIRGPIENIGLHYKCLHVLVKNMFPEVDVNNIDALIDLGMRHKFQMPSRYGEGSDAEEKELRELSIVITSGKPLPRSPISADDSDSKSLTGSVSRSNSQSGPQAEVIAIKAETREPDLKLEDEEKLCLVINQQLNLPQKDYIIVDLAGNSHCIGPLGSPGFLDSYMRIIGLKTNVDILKWASFQKIAKGEMIISSNQEPIQQQDLRFLNLEMFPYFGDIGRTEAEYYVNIFFTKIHPRCLCFDEKLFRESHMHFWEAIDTKTRNKQLSNHLISSIYMVWILGRLYDPMDCSVIVDETVIQKYLRVVKLCLSDILLMGTLDGIRCLLLLSMYMDNRKRRETGYILIELAARQAVTLGLNRRSLCLCTEDEGKKEELKRTWWSVFNMEVCFSGQMGRSSCIQIEDVNADVPNCIGVSDLSLYAPGFAGVVELTKHLYEVLQFRKFLSKSSLLAEANISRALEIHKNLTDVFESLDPELRNLQDFHGCKLSVNYRYHYYSLLLLLPFYLNVANTPSVIMTPSILNLINLCAKLSMAVADLMELSAEHQLLNGTLFQDIFYAYHAVMGLVVAYLMIKDGDSMLGFEFTLPQLDVAVCKIKRLRLSESKNVGGTLLKISRYIDAFVAGLEYLKCRPTNPVHNDEGAETEKDYPIVGGPDIPVFLAAAKKKYERIVPTSPAENAHHWDEDFLFHGRPVHSEMSFGSMDLGEMLLSEFGVPLMDGGLGDELFKLDGF